MHTKASTDTGCTDKLFHEFRLVCLKFRKLIDDYDKMRQRGNDFVVLVFFDVSIDVINFRFGKQSLPLLQFGLYR